MSVAVELKLLAAAVAVGPVHLGWASAAAQPQRGLAWNVGPRDEPVHLTGVAGRLTRAFANFRETFALFAAAVLAVVVAGKAGEALSVWGCVLYVAARTVYIPLYAFGVSYVRSLVWLVSMAGLVMVLVALFI
jgi:uncharacterized MAPEG superfamily protein